MRKKENRSDREEAEYTELNKIVKKTRRQRSRKKRTDHVETNHKAMYALVLFPTSAILYSQRAHMSV